jgi:hypothetical protein
LSREEDRGAFIAPLESRQEVARCHRVMEAVDVHRWLLARAGGGKTARPRARKFLKQRRSVAITDFALVPNAQNPSDIPNRVEAVQGEVARSAAQNHQLA